MAAATASLSFLFPTNPKTSTPTAAGPILCGPRGNRGPLLRGRVLSSEAILAVQALKRAALLSDHPSAAISRTAKRLIKGDLIAALNELLRQDRCRLAADLFSAARGEPWYRTDLAVYASLAAALARNGLQEEIDRLIADLEAEVEGGGEGIPRDEKGMAKLLRAVVAAEREESTVRIYRMMRRSGWGPTWAPSDEYVVKVLCRGLRSFGRVGVADEVEKEFESTCRGNLGNMEQLN